jgi:hypothetical protein
MVLMEINDGVREDKADEVSDARWKSTHGSRGAPVTASATVPTKIPAFGPRRIVAVADGWESDNVMGAILLSP